MGVEPRIRYLPARHEVHHAHSSHDKLRRVLGARPTTPLDDGLRAMAAWVRRQGARSSPPFKDIEVRKNLPGVWAAS
jgi:UDP-glucose 4-epimerase